MIGEYPDLSNNKRGHPDLADPWRGEGLVPRFHKWKSQIFHPQWWYLNGPDIPYNVIKKVEAVKQDESLQRCAQLMLHRYTHNCETKHNAEIDDSFGSEDMYSWWSMIGRL